MQTRVYKLYGTGSADTNALAQLVFQRRGLITCIHADLLTNGAADNDQCELEVSFASTNQLATNDTIGPIASISSFCNLATSGAYQGGRAIAVTGLAIPVDQGVRIYLHALITGTVTFAAQVYLHVLEE